jgi:HEPN domain-containing protein
MGEPNENSRGFDFEPDQLTDIGELAEAFIHEEVNAELLDELDREYLEQLVAEYESEPPADIDEDEYEAAIEVAELILDRMDAADN